MTKPLRHTLAQSQLSAAARLHRRLAGWRTADESLDTLRSLLPDFGRVSCLLKAVVVNELYATQVLAIERMAEHTEVVLRVSDLERSGPELVERIARLPARGEERPRVFMSFAAKFCHFFIDAERFPIYDEAARVMLEFHLGPKVAALSSARQYVSFCTAFRKLREAAFLTGTGRDLDRYLWITGMYERWLRQRAKSRVLVNAELRALFEAPDEMVAADLAALLPASFERP
jgi:hypothetical protein